MNLIFIGEAGSGKSEIALNAAVRLKRCQEKPVHFFDMDMTKPLFRSRDVADQLEAAGILVHYEEQFMDAPTLAGGVLRLLKDPDCCVVMDVGGDHIGARSIGGFAPAVNQEGTTVYYVLNSYRPWSGDMEHIDRTLGEILGVSHIELNQIHLISNPNVGLDTSMEDVLEGGRSMAGLVGPYKDIEFLCVKEELAQEVRQQTDMPVMPIHLYLTYPWLQAQTSVAEAERCAAMNV